MGLGTVSLFCSANDEFLMLRHRMGNVLKQSVRWSYGKCALRSYQMRSLLTGLNIVITVASDCIWLTLEHLEREAWPSWLVSRSDQLQNYLWNVRRLVSDGTWLQRLGEECCAIVKSLSWISKHGDNLEVRLNAAQQWSWVVFRGESETLVEAQRGVES